MKQYGVYFGRMLVVNIHTGKDAVFTSLYQANRYAFARNQHRTGFYVAEIIKPVKAKAGK